jgi:uncharacterized membrane protein YdjX (TVP38/TMEM64 family)
VVFGLPGGPVALLGSTAGAAAGYVAGRALGPIRLRRWTARGSHRSARLLRRRGVRGVTALRLASIARAGLMHLLCGAARVPFAPYMAGTVIGLAAPIFALAGVGALLREAILRPSIPAALTAVAAAFVLVAAAYVLRTFLLIRRLAPSISSHRKRAEFG